MAKSQRAAREPSVVIISSDDEDFRPTSPQAKSSKAPSSPSKLLAVMSKKSRDRSSSSESAKSVPPQRKQVTPVKKTQPISNKAKSKSVAAARRQASPVKRSESRSQVTQGDNSPSSSNSSSAIVNQKQSKRPRTEDKSESEPSFPPRRRQRRRFLPGTSDESESEDDWAAPKALVAKEPVNSDGKRKRGRPRKVAVTRDRSSESQSSVSPPPAPSPPRTRNDKKRTRTPSPPADAPRPTRSVKSAVSTSQRTPQKAPTTSARMSSEGTFRPEVPLKESKDQATSAEGGAPPMCVLCERSDDDRVRYFRMDSQGDLHAHYLCMFTASNLSQTEDARVKKAGTICGFLCQNVHKEKRRASRLVCKYCKKKGAAVGCAVKSCRASYHYPCGVENKCFYRFTGSFESFCPDHIPAKQFPRPKDTKNVKKECVVCLDEPDLKDKFDTLVTPCCNRALHRDCLAGHAVNAGKHFLKCPSCNMVDDFKPFCEQVGIHVPNADATWMADEEAERQREDQEPEEDTPCAAGDDCMCPNGKTFDENVAGRDWNIEVCSNGCQKQMHAACMKHIGAKGKDLRHLCAECFDLEVMVEKRLGRKVNVSQGERASRSGSPEIPMIRPTRRGRISAAS